MTITREAALEAALKDTLDFFERHSNRYDEVNGKHPQTIVEEARAALAMPATEPQPAADTRVVTQLKAISLALAKITGRDASDEAALDSLAAEIRSLRSLAGQVETP